MKYNEECNYIVLNTSVAEMVGIDVKKLESLGYAATIDNYIYIYEYQVEQPSEETYNKYGFKSSKEFNDIINFMEEEYR